MSLVAAACVVAGGCNQSNRQADPAASGTASPADNGATPVAGEPVGECSAAKVTLDVRDAVDVPAEVAEMRRQIIESALTCDYDRLERLALQPDGAFQYSRTEESAGPEARPADYWRAREQQGKRVIANLVEILLTDPRVQPVTEPEGPGSGSDDVYYNWPGPHVPDRLSDYETSITSQGDWIFFLQD